jgi:hypothetical protein
MATVTEQRPEPTDAQPPRGTSAAAIYGLIVTASVMATAGETLKTFALVIAVVLTLLVYWTAEQFAELAEHVTGGHLPTFRQARAQMASRWGLVSSSFIPLIGLLLTRALGATPYQSSIVGLAITVVLLMVHGWNAGSAAELRMPGKVFLTALAGTLGIVMILLKVLLSHLH